MNFDIFHFVLLIMRYIFTFFYELLLFFCRCILHSVIKDNEEEFAKIVALLNSFGLVYDLRSSGQKVLLVPWYLPEEIPSKVESKVKVITYFVASFKFENCRY